MEVCIVLRLLFYLLLITGYAILSYYIFKYNKVLFGILQLGVVAVFSLGYVRRLLIIPITTTVGKSFREARHNRILGAATHRRLEALKEALEQRENDVEYLDVAGLRQSLNHLYSIYAGMYISQNFLIYNSIPIKFIEFYIRLKLMLKYLSKVHLPIVEPNAIRLEIFDDLLPSLNKRLKKHLLYDKLESLPTDQDDRVTLLSALMNVNEKAITDEQFKLAFLEVQDTVALAQISTLCTDLINRVKDMVGKEVWSFFSVVKRVFSPFGNVSFLKGFAIYLFMAKWETIEIKKSFPNINSTVDTMMVPSFDILKALVRNQKQITDFNPEGKSRNQLVSMLYGTDSYERLYGEGYDYRFAQHPMTLLFNGNSSCYEFKVVDHVTLFFHRKRGHNVYMFNYANVCDSTGDGSFSSMVQDSIQVAKHLVDRFYMQFPGHNKFKLGLHGISLGGMFATKTAYYLQKHYSAEILPFVVLQKTFGHLTELARMHLGIFGLFLLRLSGACFGSYDQYPKLENLKVNIFDIKDKIIPPALSLSGTVAARHFDKDLRPVIPLLKEMHELMHSLEKEKAANPSLVPLYCTLYGLNSAGEPISDFCTSQKKGEYMHDRWMETYLARMAAYGSLPMAKFEDPVMATLSLKDLITAVTVAELPGFSIVSNGKQRYLDMPRNVAALFNMFLCGSSTIDENNKMHNRFVIHPPKKPKKGLSDEASEPSSEAQGEKQEDGNRHAGRFQLLWPDEAGQKQDELDEPPTKVLELLQRDLTYFGEPIYTVDRVRVFAWQHLYSLLHIASLLKEAKQCCSDIPNIIDPVSGFVRAFYDLTILEPEEEEGNTDIHHLLRPLDNTVFHARFHTFGNIITTNIGHNKSLTPADQELLSVLLFNNTSTIY